MLQNLQAALTGPHTEPSRIQVNKPFAENAISPNKFEDLIGFV